MLFQTCFHCNRKIRSYKAVKTSLYKTGLIAMGIYTHAHCWYPMKGVKKPAINRLAERYYE